jgi:hypothetical protein
MEVRGQGVERWIEGEGGSGPPGAAVKSESYCRGFGEMELTERC